MCRWSMNHYSYKHKGPNPQETLYLSSSQPRTKKYSFQPHWRGIKNF